MRQYSLCSDPARTDRYEIAVQREDAGRGGSVQMHRSVQAGDVLAISRPRNNFPLALDGHHHVLIAGGIGVTPLIAMAHHLTSIGASFEMHYGARSRARLAFADVLTGLCQGGDVHLYVDDGDPSRGMNLTHIVASAPEGSHVYACGPAGLLRAFSDATAGYPTEQVHVEHFAPPSGTAHEKDRDAQCEGGFVVRLARSSVEFHVAPDQTILQVLRSGGVEVPSSCEAGVCGTCRVRYLEGLPDHRDFVLDDNDRAREVLVCCGRANSPVLVLDL